MFTANTVAQLYAKAIYIYVINSNQSLDSWKQMLQFVVEVFNHKKIKNLVSQISFSHEIASFFIDLCRDQINQHVKNLVKILIENKRLIILNILFKEFINLCQKHEGVINVNVISAYKLSEQQSHQIYLVLKKKYQKKINIKYIIDKSIVDGLIIKFNDMVINLSVCFQLEKLLNILQR